MMSTNTVIRNSKIAWQKVEEKVVLVSPKTKKIHILYGTGGYLWECLEQQRSVDQLTELVCEQYDATQEQAQLDIQEFLNQMQEEDLVLTSTS